MHSCGNPARKGWSWPKFWADTASSPDARKRDTLRGLERPPREAEEADRLALRASNDGKISV